MKIKYTWEINIWSLRMTKYVFLLTCIMGHPSFKVSCSRHRAGEPHDHFAQPGQQPQDVSSCEASSSLAAVRDCLIVLAGAQGKNHFSDSSKTFDLECTINPPLVSSLSRFLNSSVTSQHSDPLWYPLLSPL